MKFRKHLKSFIPQLIIDNYRRYRYDQETNRDYGFKFNEPLDIKKDIQKKYQHNSDLLEIFATNKDFTVNKWHHYIPLYERYFSPFRGRKIRILEIGVWKGGSLKMWRKYFGDDAIIFGIDINPECNKFDGLDGQVRIGSQVDGPFLESVVKEMGGLDIVLDDGSHHMKHIPVSLKYLFPYLNNGGVYMIEDLHTSYSQTYGGGYRAKANFFEFLRDLVDDMHHWYHIKGLKQAVISKECTGIHIHDSIVVLEKNKVYEPVFSEIG